MPASSAPPVTTSPPPVSGLTELGRAFEQAQFNARNSGAPATSQTPPATAPPPTNTPTPSAAPPPSPQSTETTPAEKPALSKRELKVGGFGAEEPPEGSPSASHFKAAKDAAYARGRAEAEKELRESMLPKTDYESVVKERDELRTQLQQVSLEQDPAFQREHKLKVDSAMALARSAVGTELSKEVEQLLASPDSSAKDQAMDNILESLRPIQRAKLSAAMAKLEEANAERNALLAQAPAIAATREAQARDHQVKQTAYKKQAFSTAWSEAVEQCPDFLGAKDGNVEHGERVEQVRAMAGYIFDQASVAEVARASVQAAMYPALIKDNLTLTRQVQALTTELEKLRGGKPNLAEGGGGAPPASQPPATLDGMMSRIKELTGIR